jgi:hypothetical protein
MPLVYDRGMHAKSSVLRLANTNWKIIGGVPLHKGIKDFISKMDFQKLESYRNMHKQGDSVLYAKPFPYKMGEVSGRLIIIFNPKKRNNLKEKRFLELDKIANSKKNIPEHLKKFYNVNGKINAHALKRTERLDGLSALFVTGKISIDSAINCYYDKDLIERSFKSLKSVLGMRPIRHWLDGKVTGHLFICYLSLVLLTTFRLMIEQKGLKGLAGVTPEIALKELQAVYIIKYSNNKKIKGAKKTFYKMITLSNLQKDIFSAIVPNLNL